MQRGNRSRESVNAPATPQQVIDLVGAVKGLHGLTCLQLTKLIQDSRTKTIEHVTDDGVRIQIDVEKLARYLPLHLLAVVMAWNREKSTLTHLLRGIHLLHTMCIVAPDVPRVEQVLYDDVKVLKQLFDLVFHLLIVLATRRKEYDFPSDMVLMHSALVASSLRLLTLIISPIWQEVLTAYSKIDIVMEAAFAAVREDIKFSQRVLSAEHPDADFSATAEEILKHLYEQCGFSMDLLHSMCQQKLLQEHILKNKELCRKGGLLLLAEATMSLKISTPYNSSSLLASISKMKSKVLSMLLCLCDDGNSPYLDEVARSNPTENLTISIALQVIELLKEIFGVLPRPSIASFEQIYRNELVEKNGLHLLEVFSDDTNFRGSIRPSFAEALAGILSFSHQEFICSWCSSIFPVCEDCRADIPGSSYAHERTSLLVKIIANLHYSVVNISEHDKGRFHNEFMCFISNEAMRTVKKNLGSLLTHAESLVPGLCDKGDLLYLRLFINDFGSLVDSAPHGFHIQLESPSRDTGSHGYFRPQ